MRTEEELSCHVAGVTRRRGGRGGIRRRRREEGKRVRRRSRATKELRGKDRDLRMANDDIK